MNGIIFLYTTYTVKSIVIFTLCFVLGVIIDNQFSKLQSKYPRANKLMLGILQLLSIVTVTFILHQLKFYQIFLEAYNPNILFSSFLFSLQSTMINNFKSSLGSIIYNYVNL